MYMYYHIVYLQTVGCDGIIGSGAVEDQCGICNGDGKTCRVIAGIFTRVYLPRGYNLITRIPAGACKINITEMARSRNYLGKLSIDGKKYLAGCVMTILVQYSSIAFANGFCHLWVVLSDPDSS